MAIFALTITLVAFDWISGLEPEWYSDIFGVYLFAGAFLAGLAATALGVLYLQDAGRLQGVQRRPPLQPGRLPLRLHGVLVLHRLRPVHAHVVREPAGGGLLVPGAPGRALAASSPSPWRSSTSSCRSSPWSPGTRRAIPGACAGWPCLMLGAHALDLYWLIFPVLGTGALLLLARAGFALFFLGGVLLWVRGAMAEGRGHAGGRPLPERGPGVPPMIDPRLRLPRGAASACSPPCWWWSGLHLPRGLLRLHRACRACATRPTRPTRTPRSRPCRARPAGWIPRTTPPQASQIIPPVDPKTVMTPNPALLARGKALYAQTCATCHGAEGKGDGPGGKGLNPKPRNFTAERGLEERHPRRGHLQDPRTRASRAAPWWPTTTSRKKDRMALVHLVQSLGAFDHGASDPKALAALEQLFASAGEVIPNRIPVRPPWPAASRSPAVRRATPSGPVRGDPCRPGASRPDPGRPGWAVTGPRQGRRHACRRQRLPSGAALRCRVAASLGPGPGGPQ